MTLRATLPDLDTLDATALKALILTQHEETLLHHEQLASRDAEFERLKLLIAKLQRMQFGRRSEKLARQMGARAQEILRSGGGAQIAVAQEALERIAQLSAIEEQIRGRPLEERRGVCHQRSRPLLEQLKQWLEETLVKLSRKSDTARAVKCALAVGKLWCVSSTMAASKSTTTRRSVPCARWFRAARIICSLVPTWVVNPPHRSTV